MSLRLECLCTTVCSGVSSKPEMKPMGNQQRVQELALKIRILLEELALYAGASGYIWMVIKKEGGNIGGCSANLKPYEAALADEAEKATERPVIVTLEGDPPTQLPKTERVLLALAKTRHVELHPIVAMMIQGLNEINNHKIPRVKALADPRTMPQWFPLSPDAYASRSQKMDLHQLFSVLDSVFNTIRGSVRSIRALHQMLDKAYKSGSCSIGTRAGMDSFFHFLEEEALGANVAAKADAIADVSGAVPGYENYLRFGNAPSAFEEWGGLAARGGGESASSGLPQTLPPHPNAFLFPVREYANGGCMLPGMVGEEQRLSLVNDTPPLPSGGLLQALGMQYEAVAGANGLVAPETNGPVAGETSGPVAYGASEPVADAGDEPVAYGGSEPVTDGVGEPGPSAEIGNELVANEINGPVANGGDELVTDGGEGLFASEQPGAMEIAAPVEALAETAAAETALVETEGPEKVSEVVESFASHYVGSEFLWVVTSNEGKVGGCSSQLEPYAPAIMDQVERAAQAPIALPSSASSPIPKMSDVLRFAQNVRHIELWQFVAAMMTALDGVTGQKAPKKRARKDPSQVPSWFPLAPEKYAARVQGLTQDGLLQVLDAMFGHARGKPSEIAKLRDGVDQYFAKNPLCLLEFRAGVEALLACLENDAGLESAAASGSVCGRKIIRRTSALRNKGEVGEVETVGVTESPSVKVENLDTGLTAGGDAGAMGVAGEEEQGRSSEKATGSGEDESSGHSPAIARLGKVGQGLAGALGPVMGRNDSGKENIDCASVEGSLGISDDGSKGAVADAQEMKPLEGVTGVRSRKRSRRGSESGGTGVDGKEKIVYKPQAQKAYGRMLSLFEAAGLDTSAAGPVVG